MSQTSTRLGGYTLCLYKIRTICNNIPSPARRGRRECAFVRQFREHGVNGVAFLAVCQTGRYSGFIYINISATSVRREERRRFKSRSSLLFRRVHMAFSRERLYRCSGASVARYTAARVFRPIAGQTDGSILLSRRCFQ